MNGASSEALSRVGGANVRASTVRAPCVPCRTARGDVVSLVARRGLMLWTLGRVRSGVVNSTVVPSAVERSCDEHGVFVERALSFGPPTVLQSMALQSMELCGLDF